MKNRVFSNKFRKIAPAAAFFIMSLAVNCASPQKPQNQGGAEIRKLAIGITTKDPYYQNLALSNMTNVANHLPGTVQIEIVVWGPALPMLLKGSPHEERISNLMLLGEIKFTACGNTMDTVKRKTGKEPVLLDGVQRHQVGVERIMTLQEKGYSLLQY